MNHSLGKFPILAIVALQILTLGLFAPAYFAFVHGKLPKNRPDDPSGGQAFGYLFLPFVNLYWPFFVLFRLALRLNEQFRARGLPESSAGRLMLIGYLGGALKFVPLAIEISGASSGIFQYVYVATCIVADVSLLVGTVALQRSINRLCDHQVASVQPVERESDDWTIKCAHSCAQCGSTLPAVYREFVVSAERTWGYCTQCNSLFCPDCQTSSGSMMVFYTCPNCDDTLQIPRPQRFPPSEKSFAGEALAG